MFIRRNLKLWLASVSQNSSNVYNLDAFDNDFNHTQYAHDDEPPEADDTYVE
jgi:hypothetical protein